MELLARAVMLGAGLKIPQAARAAVLEQVVADMDCQAVQQPEG